MSYLLEVCLVAVTLAASMTPSIAAQPAAPPWEKSFVRRNLGGENERSSGS